MKSVGEAMVIGRRSQESLQKYRRSLEIGRSGLGGDGKPWRISTEVYGDRDLLPRDVISRKLSVPNAKHIFFIRVYLRCFGFPDSGLKLCKTVPTLCAAAGRRAGCWPPRGS